MVSRLAYRKGIDLFVAAAPRICREFPQVHFIIGNGDLVFQAFITVLPLFLGGDGPKLIDILQMREKYQLQDQIELLGSVKSGDVRSVSLCYCFQFHIQSVSEVLY